MSLRYVTSPPCLSPLVISVPLSLPLLGPLQLTGIKGHLENTQTYKHQNNYVRRLACFKYTNLVYLCIFSVTKD